MKRISAVEGGVVVIVQIGQEYHAHVEAWDILLVVVVEA